MTEDNQSTETQNTENPLEFDYKMACELWAKMDHWRVEDAARLVLKLMPKVFNQTGKPSNELKANLLTEYALSCAGKTLRLLGKTANPDGQPRVMPITFIEWCERTNGRVPAELLTAIDLGHLTPELLRDLPNLRQPMNHPEYHRCRAIAEMLWEQKPSTSIADMCKDRRVIQFGLKGVERSPSSVRRWIKDLAPNPQVGRPPNTPY